MTVLWKLTNCLIADADFSVIKEPGTTLTRFISGQTGAYSMFVNPAQIREAAARIVEIQSTLATAELDPGARIRLNAEQRSLWDEAFHGQPFERIAAIH